MDKPIRSIDFQVSVMGWLKLMVGLIVIMNVASHKSNLKKKLNKLQMVVNQIIEVNDELNERRTLESFVLLF